jgi:hypothetical protein
MNCDVTMSTGSRNSKRERARQPLVVTQRRPGLRCAQSAHGHALSKRGMHTGMHYQ